MEKNREQREERRKGKQQIPTRLFGMQGQLTVSHSHWWLWGCQCMGIQANYSQRYFLSLYEWRKHIPHTSLMYYLSTQVEKGALGSSRCTCCPSCVPGPSCAKPGLFLASQHIATQQCHFQGTSTQPVFLSQSAPGDPSYLTQPLLFIFHGAQENANCLLQILQHVPRLYLQG